MTFKNQRTACFRQRAVTINANAVQDLRGYWTKVHQICKDKGKIFPYSLPMPVVDPGVQVVSLLGDRGTYV